MYGLSEAYRYFMCTIPVRGNANADTLFHAIADNTPLSPVSGDAYVFFTTDLKKIIVFRWDGENFIIFNKCLIHKRLQIDFKNVEIACFELSYDDLFTLLRKNHLVVPRGPQKSKMRIKKLIIG